MSERRGMSLTQVAVAVTLMLNIGALIWGAATLTASVNELSRNTVQLSVMLERINSQVSSQEARLQVLEDRTRPERLRP